MRLSDFDFRIDCRWAQFPTVYRDEARLMVLHKSSGTVEHKMIPDLLDYVAEGDMIVFNDTKVIPASHFATKDRTGAAISVRLQRDLGAPDHKLWDAFMTPARKVRVGNKIFFNDDASIVGEVIDNVTSRGRMLRFISDYTADFKEHLFAIGHMPMLRYIDRPMSDFWTERFNEAFPGLTEDDLDNERYQSIFAKHEGSVMPCEGALNISEGMVMKLKLKDLYVDTVTCTNGTGMNEVLPVEDIFKHKMPSDYMVLSQLVADHANETKREGCYVIAVGCEVLRALEVTKDLNGLVQPYEGWTNLLMAPGYQYKIVDALLCGFYDPFTPSIIAACAFGGYNQVIEAYRTACLEGYRFGAYGDNLLILPD